MRKPPTPAPVTECTHEPACGRHEDCRLWGHLQCLRYWSSYPQASLLSPGLCLCAMTSLQGNLSLNEPAQSRCPTWALLSSLLLAGHWEEPEEAGKSDSELQEPRNGEEPAGPTTASSQGLPHGPWPMAHGLADPCLSCCSQALSRPRWCFPSRPTPSPAVPCWRSRCPLTWCSLVSLWYVKCSS